MQRHLALRVEAHALFAARHHHGLACDDAGKLLGCRMDRRITDRIAARRNAQLAPVRRDDGRAAVDRKVRGLGIDDHRNARALRTTDDFADDARRQHALGVVG